MPPPAARSASSPAAASPRPSTTCALPRCPSSGTDGVKAILGAEIQAAATIHDRTAVVLRMGIRKAPALGTLSVDGDKPLHAQHVRVSGAVNHGRSHTELSLASIFDRAACAVGPEFYAIRVYRVEHRLLRRWRWRHMRGGVRSLSVDAEGVVVVQIVVPIDLP